MSEQGEAVDASVWEGADETTAVRRFRTLTGAIDGGIYQVDAAGRFVAVDDEFATELGYERDDLVGEHVSILLADADASRVEDAIATAAETGDAATLELPVRTASGDRRYFELRLSPHAVDGDDRGAVGLARDLTDRREADEKLKRYEVLFTESRDVNAVLDADGRFRYVTPSAASVLGYEPAELVGERAFDYVHPEDREQIAEEYDRLVEDPDCEPTVEYRFRHADGSWVVLESRGRNLLEDPTIEGIVVYSRDVTERRERERKLRTQERRLSRLIDNVPGMVYRCRNEPGWPMEFVSDACRDLTGYDPEELEGGALSFGEDVVAEADRDDLWTDVQRGIDGDGTFLATYRIETRSGDVRWVRERGRGIYDDEGELAGIEGVIIDVTQRKRLETELDEILGRVTDAFYALDDEWRFTHVNDRAEELLRYSKGELLGKSLWEVFPEAAEETDVWESFHEAMETQEARSFELYFDRLEFWVEATVYPSETGVSVYFQDVTGQKRTEQRLTEERDMFAQGPAITFRWENREGWPVEYVSENVEDLLGYAPEDLESGDVPYTDLLLDEEIDRIAREVEENTDDSTEWFDHEPYRIETSDGDVRWVKDTTKIVRGETGDVTHYLGYLVDITERKESERELAKYETIVETVNDGIYVVDDEGRFTTVNEAYAEMLGYSREELIGEHVSRVVDEETAREARELETEMHDGEVDQPAIEADMITASGDRIPSEATFAMLSDADGGERRIGVARDVSERKERERELRRKERRYETVFEDPNILVGLLEPDGTVLDINETAMEYIDDDLSEVAGESFWETPWWGEGDDLQSDVREWVERAAAGEYVDFEADLTRPDGQGYTLSGYFRPVTDDDGEVVSIIVSDRDVTERVERERELERNERRYRTLVEYFPSGIVTLFDHDLEYTLAAGQGFDYVSVDPEDLEGQSFRDVWGGIASELEPAFQSALDGEERSVELEYAGREWVFQAVPITDERGEVFAGMTMAWDITERKERERELAKYETIIETMNDGIYVKDEDGYFTMVNDAYAELTGYDRDELVGKHASLVVDEDAIRQSREMRAATGGGDEAEPAMEAPIRTADGDSVPAEGTFASIRTGDGERKDVGVVRDISERKERERALEESERRYRTLVENFPDGAVGLFDENLEYTAVGGQLLERGNMDSEDRVGSSVSDLYPEAVVQEVEPRFRAALDGESSSFEVEYQGMHLFAHTLPVRNAEDDVFAGMLVVQDVTERREIERDLRESEAKFRMLAENLEEVVWMASPDAAEFIYVNPAFEEVWGIDRDALYDDPTSFLDAVHPDDSERVEAAFRALPDEDFEEEFRIVRPDGEVRWLHVRGGEVRDEAGEMVRIVGIGEDVTERIERERALEESERRYRTLAENFPNGAVGVYDRDLRYTLTEGAVLGDTLPSAEALQGDKMADVFPDGVAADLEPLFRAAVEDGETGNTTTEFGGRDWRVWAAPLRDADGDVFAGLSIAQDVTEQVEREQRLEELVGKLEVSNERLEQFAYAASHDLQEPLRMVSSYLSLIDRRYADELDDDGREFIEFAVDGAERMREMIDALLTYSRVETRGDPFEPVDLDDVFADVLDDFQVTLEESDATVDVASLPRVRGDAGQLRQVFGNLLSNAVEYSGEEPPRVRVAAERDGSEWRIAVSDEGIGIEPEHTDSVFEVFQRLHTQDEHAGTGIGLALCQRIVERHGGDIWADSEPGEGSTFYFTLPAEEDSND